MIRTTLESTWGIGRNAVRGTRNRQSTFATVRDSNRQRAVLGGPRSGDEAVGYLALHREKNLPRPGTLEQLEDDGGGDVVGDVADDQQLSPIVADGADIKSQKVLVPDVDMGAVTPFGGEFGSEAVVQLYENQTAGPVHEVPGEGAAAWSDLQDGIGWGWVEGIDDLALEVGIDQEVLSKRPLGPHGNRRPRSSGRLPSGRPPVWTG